MDEFLCLDLAQCHEALEETLDKYAAILERLMRGLTPAEDLAPGDWPELDQYVAMIDGVRAAFVREMPRWLAKAADAEQAELSRQMDDPA